MGIVLLKSRMMILMIHLVPVLILLRRRSPRLARLLRERKINETKEIFVVMGFVADTFLFFCYHDPSVHKISNLYIKSNACFFSTHIYTLIIIQRSELYYVPYLKNSSKIDCKQKNKKYSLT